MAGTADAQPRHTYRVRGTATGVDNVVVDESCADFHVTGGGNQTSAFGNGTYAEDLCATEAPAKHNGDLVYTLSGQFGETTAKGTMHGSVSGTAVLDIADNYYDYDIHVNITSGTGSLTGAKGTLNAKGKGTFDYSDGVQLDDTLTFRATIKV
jgi:hypothetical protein